MVGTNRWENNPLDLIDARPPYTLGSKVSLAQLRKAEKEVGLISKVDVKERSLSEPSIPIEWSDKVKNYIEKTEKGAEISIKYDRGIPTSRIEYTFNGETVKLPFRLTGEHLKKAYSKLEEAFDPYVIHNVAGTRCRKVIGPDKR